MFDAELCHHEELAVERATIHHKCYTLEVRLEIWAAGVVHARTKSHQDVHHAFARRAAKDMDRASMVFWLDHVWKNLYAHAPHLSISLWGLAVACLIHHPHRTMLAFLAKGPMMMVVALTI
jgi:hypothetical protein